MHTAAPETHDRPSRGPRFLQSEDTTIATIGAWTVGLLIFTLAGFYFGTIAGHDNHPPAGVRHQDLNPPQLMNALPYAAGGLILGLVFALWISFGYVPAKLRELDQEGVSH